MRRRRSADGLKLGEAGDSREVAVPMPDWDAVLDGDRGDQAVDGRTDGEAAPPAVAEYVGGREVERGRERIGDHREGKQRVALLRRATEVEALPESWRAYFRNRLEKLGGA